MRMPPSPEAIAEQLKAAKLRWFRCQLSSWAKHHLRDFPWRRTKDPYAIFVAEFLLQQTSAATVLPIFQAFLSQYPNINALALAPVAEVARLLQPLGLFFRAECLCQSAQLVVETYEGKIPDKEAHLLTLPGVGKYTARSVCANAFGQPLAVLDTNVARILERFFGLQGGRVKSRCKLLWQAAEQVAPDEAVGRWNLTLIDFGAAVCKVKNPRCHECPLRQHCSYLAVN